MFYPKKIRYSKKKFNYPNSIDSDTKTKQILVKHYYYKILDKWLWDELSDILNYFSYSDNNIILNNNLSNSNNLNLDSDSVIDKKIYFLEHNILTKKKTAKLLKKFTKDIKIKWVDIPKHEAELRIFTRIYLTNLIKKKSQNKSGGVLVLDPVWAPNGYPITDTRILKLLDSKTITRLGYIGQAGPLNHIESPEGYKSTVTRKEHSIGCMILTLKVGGTLDEGIAALLHDIMHTAFSHTMDFYMESPEISYHEIHKDELLAPFGEELTKILGSNWNNYLKAEKWPLVKNNKIFATDIADSIVRDSLQYGLLTNRAEVLKMTDLLAIGENRQLSCKTQAASDWWRETAQRINSQVWASPVNTAMNYYLAKTIKTCINKNIISEQGLIQVTDPEIENKTISCVTKNDGFLFEIPKKIWKFVDLSDNNPKYHEVFKLTVRERIIKPPVIGQPYIPQITENQNKKLIWMEKN